MLVNGSLIEDVTEDLESNDNEFKMRKQPQVGRVMWECVMWEYIT